MIRKTLYLLAALCLPSCALAMQTDETASTTLNTTESQLSLLEQFPPEIIVMVLDYLDPESKKALFLASKGLYDLRYLSTRITLIHRRGIPCLLKMPRLNALDIDCDLGSKAILAPILEKLKIVVFFRNHVRTADLEALRGSTQLRELDLSYTHVTNEDLSHLTGLVNLQKLNLRSCPYVSSDGLRAMGAMENLQHLDLRETDIKLNRKDLDFLTGVPNVRYLGLNRAIISDEVLAVLRVLELCLPHLQRFDLSIYP